MKYKRPSAKLSQSRAIPILVLVTALLAAWAVEHAFTIYYQAVSPQRYSGQRLGLVFFLAFWFLAATTVLSFFDKPKKVNKREQAMLNRLRLVAVIPVYNEDPELLRRCIDSIISQSRRPNQIFVVDDGSTTGDYKEIKSWARKRAKEAKVSLRWERTANGGKRHAQAVAFSNTPRAKVYLTVDSDSVLDYQAIKEGLKPFVDPSVKSVAGVAMSLNCQKNLLTRFADLFFVMGQVIDRSSMSTMGSVLVNSGVLAFYRADIIKKNLNGYVNETFFGKHVDLSDDSLLTLYAINDGKAVQQKSSFAFTVMPENINHHLRQYVRWMRGAFIRTLWRFKYLPLKSYGYWQHLISWVLMFVALAVFIAFYVVNPFVNHALIVTLLLIPILISYGQALFYLTIRRSDVSLKSQLTTYSTALVSGLWSYFVLRFVRWYGIFTCYKTGWGTRKNIEVKV